MKKKLAIILAAVMATALCACGGGGGGSEEKSEAASGSAGDLGTELVLYTPMTDSDIEALLTCFNEKYPDINVDVVSGSIGELTAKIQAEADNPQADLVWGGVQDSDGEQYAAQHQSGFIVFIYILFNADLLILFIFFLFSFDQLIICFDPESIF